MVSFEEKFMESKGKPISYEGNTLVMSDFFPTRGMTKFRLVIESCNGKPVEQDPPSTWAPDRGCEHRTAEGFFRTSVDGLAPWRNVEPSGKWRQGVLVRLVFADRKGQWKKGAGPKEPGKLSVHGKVANGRDGVVFWQSTEWNIVEFEVAGGARTLHIYNVWDCGNGVVEAGHNGAAMIVEEIPDGRRYRCNDGFADDDFDDLVFRLERVGSGKGT
jgi:hypothetical protein